MTVPNSLLSPISITFAVIVLGYYLGRIKILNLSFDLSGVLIIAVFTGWLLSVLSLRNLTVDITEYDTYMNMISAFGTALFVSSIGVSTGNELNFQNRNDMKSALIGSLMVCSSFATMRIISILDSNISDSRLLGVLCGALTTTPGLSAACELNTVVSQEAVLGYGCAYLFGVTATVLFVQVKDHGLKSAIKEEQKNNIKSKSALTGLVQIGLVVVIGRLFGSINISGFSLGSTGGMLCCGIVMGFIVKKFIPVRSLSAESLAPFRNMGLVLFFVGNGIPAGMQLSERIDAIMIAYGAILTIVPILIGVFLHKIFFNGGSPATTIAGGMTSTPAIGVIVEKNPGISLTGYALSYFGALITTVFLIRLC